MSCEACGIYRYCKTPRIKARGNYNNPKVLIFGEAPGTVEDEEGKPFVGPSGGFLDDVLASLGISNDDVYISNVVKCCPYRDTITQTGTRSPTDEELTHCRPFLLRELDMFNPEETVIVTLGTPALTAFVPKNNGILRENGRVRYVTINDKKWKLYPTYHPAFILRKDSNSSHDDAKRFAQVFKMAMNIEDDIDWEIVGPSEALSAIKTIKEAYLDKAINYTIFDTETTGLITWKHKIFMYSLFARGITPRSIAIPLLINNINEFPNYPYSVSPIDISLSPRDIAMINAAIGDLITTVPIAGHNIKYDAVMCTTNNIAPFDKIKIFTDTYNMANVTIGRNMFGSVDLKTLCVALFGVQDWEVPVSTYLSFIKLKAERSYDKVPTSIMGKYSALDSLYNDSLLELLSSKVTPELEEVINLQNEAIRVFGEAEIKGVRRDLEIFDMMYSHYTTLMSSEKDAMRKMVEPWYREKLDKLIQDNTKKKKPYTMQEMMDMVFNPSSALQKQSIVFEYFKCPVIKRGKPKKKGEQGAPSCDKEVIEELQKHKKVPQEAKAFLGHLTQYNIVDKIITSYLSNTEDYVDGNMYYPNYNINGTITGRLTSPFHSMPKKSDVKRLFVSRWREDGGLMLIADFSQLELRVISSMSNEGKFLKAFEQGIDIHLNTAAEIFHVSHDKVSSEQRKVGKTVNFGIVFGLTDQSLANDIGSTLAEAHRIMDSLMSGCTNLRDWLDYQHKYVDEHGYIKTMFGRAIDIIGDDRDPEAAHRCAGNYPVQSSAADLCTSSIVRLYRYFKSRGLRSIIVGSVHDSILVDVYPGELHVVTKAIKYICETENRKLYDWIKCPIVIDVGIGTSWGGCIDFDVEMQNNLLILRGSGIRKDFVAMQAIAGDCYKIDITTLSEKPISEFAPDKAVRDGFEWDAEVKIAIAA